MDYLIVPCITATLFCIAAAIFNQLKLEICRNAYNYYIKVEDYCDPIFDTKYLSKETPKGISTFNFKKDVDEGIKKDIESIHNMYSILKGYTRVLKPNNIYLVISLNKFKIIKKNITYIDYLYNVSMYRNLFMFLSMVSTCATFYIIFSLYSSPTS